MVSWVEGFLEVFVWVCFFVEFLFLKLLLVLVSCLEVYWFFLWFVVFDG